MTALRKMAVAVTLALLFAPPAGAADTKISALPSAGALGSTDVVPVVQGGTTKKATIDQVANYVGVKVLCQSSGEVSHTGDTVETTLGTCTVPGGSMGVNGRIEVWAQFRYTNSANTKTIRCRWGGLAGTIMATGAPTTSTATGFLFFVANLNSASSQFGSSFSTVAASGGTGTVNTASDTTVVCSAQNANSGDTSTLSSWRVLLFPHG